MSDQEIEIYEAGHQPQRLYRLKITNEDEELEDLALCYARSKEEAIKKFEELYTGVKENQVEEVFFNKWNIAILTDY